MIKGCYRLNLLDNAIDFLNSSLRYVSRSKQENNPLLWKFAILHLTQALELILKERLRIENPVLLFANLDRFVPQDQRRTTVSWYKAIERLKYVLGSDMIQIDAGRLSLAYELRNNMVHYDVNLLFPETYDQYSNVLNYATTFYDRFLLPKVQTPLSERIEPDLVEELNLAYLHFDTDIVYYNDIFMSKLDRDGLKQEQERTHLTIDGVQWKRIPYGYERQHEQMEPLYSPTYTDRPCHDCLTKKGDLHNLGCDVEMCSRCHHQLISCGCIQITGYKQRLLGHI